MLSIIIDTDIGCDCDDAGALAVAHALRAHGKCDLPAFTSCTSRVDGCTTIDVINEYYGVKNSEIGIYAKEGFLDDSKEKYYSKYIKRYFKSGLNKREDCQNAIKLLRKSLVNAKKDNVSIVAIGPMMNMAGLINSLPDEISPLSGVALIKEKNCTLVCMAGSFSGEFIDFLEVDGVEWNVKQAVPEAQSVFESWPTNVFVIPFETAFKLQSGANLKNTPFFNPIRISYEQFGTITRSSWDPCTVFFSVEPNNPVWQVSKSGKVTVKDNGKSNFSETKGGNHYIVSSKDDSRIIEILDELIGWVPETTLKNQIAFS